MPAPSLLAFFAHPDDEAFSCAGTLAAASSCGFQVTVVSATRGEAGRARDGSPQSGLAARRSAELAQACSIVGAGPPRFLELADGRLAGCRDELARRLRRTLRSLRVDAAITLGSDGAYGHLDHVTCTQVLTDHAEVENGSPGGFTVLHTVFPPGMFAALRQRLARAPVPLAPPTGPGPPADHVVDIRPFAPRKLAAIAAHRSQLVDGDPRSFLMPGLVDRLLDRERFHHEAGPALKGPLARLFGDG